MMKTLLTAALMMLVTTGTQANVIYQAGLMSDYLFRGITQTEHDLAVYAQATNNVGNAYAGAGVINIEAPEGSEGLPIEMDVNFGYNNKFDGFNIDLEVITYNYLVDTQGDETEFKIGTTPIKHLDISLYRGIKNKTWYAETTYEKTLKNRLYLDARLGYWIQDEADDNALTARVELGRDFPELYGIDIYGAIDYISDETPFGNSSDSDDPQVEFVLGIRKNF
jgi:uncharacterized protein (TIGR02001 family)